MSGRRPRGGTTPRRRPAALARAAGAGSSFYAFSRTTVPALTLASTCTVSSAGL